ncbi:hypothetical protein OC844_001418 [Tilletia horrida]|nr:hypothetical protein OC844_001418 [Tilletia horrida]
MASYDVQVECTPSPGNIAPSRSFPQWHGALKASATSPALSSCSGSGSDSDTNGTESSLPSYSNHQRHHSLTFSFPLPPHVKDVKDVKVQSGSVEPPETCEEVLPLQVRKDRRASNREPPPYLDGMRVQLAEQQDEIVGPEELQNISRLQASMSLLQLPDDTFYSHHQDVDASHCQSEAPNESLFGNHGHQASQSFAEPPRLELAFAADTDGPLNFDTDDLTRLATMLKGVPTNLTHPDSPEQVDCFPSSSTGDDGDQSASTNGTDTQSPILSGLLKETAADELWEVNIALQQSDESDGQTDGVTETKKPGETAILRLELSPVEVAQLFSLPIAMASPPQLTLDAREISAEITVDELYDGIEIAASSPDTVVDDDPLAVPRVKLPTLATSKTSVMPIPTPRVQEPAVQDLSEPKRQEIADEADIAAIFSSPALNTPDIDGMPTPAMMDSWPTPIMTGPSAGSNIDSIARLLDSAKPVGVTISAPMLSRQRSEKGTVVHNDAAGGMLSSTPMLSNLRSPRIDPRRHGMLGSLGVAEMCASPAAVGTPSILHRPRAKPRRDATSFFGTTRRDTERKLTMERLLSKSSLDEGAAPIPVSQSLGSVALPSDRREESGKPAIPHRNSSHGRISPSPAHIAGSKEAEAPAPDAAAAAPATAEAVQPMPAQMSTSASVDSCTYHIVEDSHVHDNDSSPAAYWDETRQMIGPGPETHGAGHALLDALRRQRASTLEMPRQDVPDPVSVPAPMAMAVPIPAPQGVVPPTPATLQKVRTPKGAKNAGANGQATSPTRSMGSSGGGGFGGQIFKAFRRSPRSPAAASAAKPSPPAAGAVVAPAPVSPPHAHVRPILVKQATGAVPMAPSASKQSAKTVASTASSRSTASASSQDVRFRIARVPVPVSEQKSPPAAAPAPAVAPVVLKGQALQDVKQACAQKAALIRAAAMVAAAEEQRAAASAAYRAAEAALLASRRQSAAAAPVPVPASLAASGGHQRGKRSVESQQIAQILFGEGGEERRHYVPSIRAVKTPPRTSQNAAPFPAAHDEAVVAGQSTSSRSQSQAPPARPEQPKRTSVNVSETVLLSF